MEKEHVLVIYFLTNEELEIIIRRETRSSFDYRSLLYFILLYLFLVFVILK